MWAADHYNIVLIILTLWEFPKYVLIVFTPPSPTLPRSPLFPFPPNFVSFFFFFFFSQNKAILCCQNMLGCEAFQWSLVILLQTTLLEKTDRPFFNSWVANSSSARGETSFPTSLCMTGSGLTWACRALWVLSRFYMGSCPVVSSCFFATIHYFWLLHSFWPLSCNHPWSLGGAVIDLFSLALSS